VSDLEDAFERLLGHQPSDQERQRLYRVRDALKLKTTDALWVLLMALQHYETVYEKIPARIADEATRTMNATRLTAEAEAKAAQEQTKQVLYKVLAEHWRSFLAEADARDEAGRGLPRFVVDEVEAFLRCGILAHGFLRVPCDDCRESRLVAFSCKRRGFCPSCLGRRMCDFAAHLRDHVMPQVPVRQWVLTVPIGLRFGMAFDPGLAGIILRTFVGVLSRWLRRRSREHGIRGTLKTGGVTVIQRFGSALNLNVHFHTLMMDGVYQIPPNGAAVFHPVPAPTDADVAALIERIRHKIARKLDARGDDDGAGMASAEPALATLAGASVAGIAATGRCRGARPMRLGSGSGHEATTLARRCAAFEGFSLHANVRIAANHRDGLEHLARYLARPPIATERLIALPDGRVALRFKRPFSDGTEAVAFTPFELIERLLPLVPRPRKHTIRFHGISRPRRGSGRKSYRCRSSRLRRRNRLRPLGAHHIDSPGPTSCDASS
jgi:Putative transposase/Transposase zinc-binding domain